jgi:hypothetical protein
MYDDVLTTVDDPEISGGQTFQQIRIAVGDCVLTYTGAGGRGEAGARGGRRSPLELRQGRLRSSHGHAQCRAWRCARLLPRLLLPCSARQPYARTSPHGMLPY